MSDTLERTIVQPRPPSFEKITENVYINRRCLTKFALEEADVCQCRPENGSGCTETCLNRSLFTECIAGTCPCGDVCQNQRLQKRKWATVSLRHFGVKGWGVVAEEALICGQLVVEYIGEVCDLPEVERRSRRYEQLGLRNTYIMNLNPNEVIDATAMGNYSRFINHSCNPNAECQKWTVKGEQRIAIFATQDVPVGDEITYNYNLDWNGGRRVKCQCGAYNCSGFLGAESVLWRKTVEKMPKKRALFDECFIATDMLSHEMLLSPDSGLDTLDVILPSTPNRFSTPVMTRSRTAGLYKTSIDSGGSTESTPKLKRRRAESLSVMSSLEPPPPPESTPVEQRCTPIEKQYPLFVTHPLPRKYSEDDPPMDDPARRYNTHPLLLSVSDAVPLAELLRDPFIKLNQAYYMAVADINLTGILLNTEQQQ